MVRKRPPVPGFQEASTPFVPASLSLGGYLKLSEDVLAAYEYTCAVTQTQLSAETTVSANLVVIPVHPVETGGELVRGNLLPMLPEAAQAFRDGDFSVGVDFELIVDLSRIDPQLLGSLHHSGKLLLPENRDFLPDADSLRYHRLTIFMAVGA